MNKFAAILGAASLCLSLSSRAESVRQIRDLPWTVAGGGELQRALPDAAAVDAFIQSILPKPDEDVPPPIIAEGDPRPGMGAYKFVDLNGDGRAELLCILNNGRFDQTVLVVARGPRGFVYSEADNGGGREFPPIRDLIVHAGGGTSGQILLTRDLRACGASEPCPLAYDIWKFSQGQLRRANLEYFSYYRNVLLPPLVRELEGIKHDDERYTDRDEEIKAVHQSINEMQKMLVTKHIPEFGE